MLLTMQLLEMNTIALVVIIVVGLIPKFSELGYRLPLMKARQVLVEWHTGRENAKIVIFS